MAASHILFVWVSCY